MVISPVDWALAQVSGGSLPDARLQKRAAKILRTLAEHPGFSFPNLFPVWADLKATYRFFANEKVTPKTVQAEHKMQTLKALEHAHNNPVLLIEDTSEISFSGKQKIEGLGPIGYANKGQGVHLHSTLAVISPCEKKLSTALQRAPLEVFGLVDQQFHIRTLRPKNEAINDKKKRQSRPRESQLWEQSAKGLGNAPEGAIWRRVCDRGADVYEFLQCCKQLRQGFRVRAAQDRCLSDGKTRVIAGKLFETVRAQKSVGEVELELRSRPQQKARRAKLSISCVAVKLRSPQRPGKAPGNQPAIFCTAVRAFESDPPKGVKGLEWIILCDEKIEEFQDAVAALRDYSCRWLIEEFHKALKSGVGVEELQLTHSDRLFPAIALMSLVALRLIDLRERLRLTPDADAQKSGFSQLEIQALSAKSKRQLKTVNDIALALGKLGGHIGRKNDGPPGLVVLWRGLDRLQTLIEGIKLAQQLNTYG